MLISVCASEGVGLPPTPPTQDPLSPDEWACYHADEEDLPDLPDTRDETFGARLRGHRMAAVLSQEELAQRAGLSANAVGQLERGERKHPYPHTVRSLADGLVLSEQERSALVACGVDAPELVCRR